MTETAHAPVRFHLSLNVSDLPGAVTFFERLLGTAPAKSRADYAKFELDAPPLVLSLEPSPPSSHGQLNHIGFRFADAAALVDAQRRLEEAGIRTQREEGVECCYAKQSKFWVHDLDRRLWEFYILEGDIAHRGAGQAPERFVQEEAAQPAAATQPAGPAVYEHFMGQPFTPPANCDEIRLRGTFNTVEMGPQAADTLLAAAKNLSPGGLIHLHQLTADVAVSEESLDLPGRAAVVKYVPARESLLEALQRAGFQQITLQKFGSVPCFRSGDVELRETIIEARSPSAETCSALFDVIYKGPFAMIEDDEGHVYRRGQRTPICDRTWRILQAAGMAEHFTRVAGSDAAPAACSAGTPALHSLS